MSNYSERIAKLSPAKLELLAQQLKARTARAAKIQPIPRRPTAQTTPLSFAQQRLWFLDQLAPGSATYNITTVIRFVGQLNVGALAQSLDEIIRRHEVLRTSFPSTDGQPVQIIADSARIKLTLVNLQELAEAERESAAQRLAQEETQQPFDLAQGPLLRATLLQVDKTVSVALLTMHHIISDGWSRGVLTREIAALYEAFAKGQTSALPALAIQYADYAVWQRKWLQGEVLEKQLAYWRQQLAETPVLELSTDKPRRALQHVHGATQTSALPLDLTEALKSLSRQDGATLFMTLLAALNVLLWRYSGQTDIVVGTPVAGRNRLETEALIGFFVNTLALRTQVNPQLGFRELLARVVETTLAAHAHQDVPFERLVEELQPERRWSHTPLFQIMFIAQNTSQPKLKLSTLLVNAVPTENETAKFDLTVAMREAESGLIVSFAYNTDLFEGATIKRMMGHFETLLGGLVANPQESISSLPLMRESERQQLLVEWNETKRDYPGEYCLHEQVERQAALTPNAVALIHEETQVSYRELNERANQVGHYLQRQGVGPEGRVGVLLGRSVEMVVGLLGILKAGGAYVPLDPQYPPERLTLMAADAGLRVVLTQQHWLGDWAGGEAELVCLDGEAAWLRQEARTNPTSRARAENLAYVIYTSGSTGQPKGVAITHGSAVTLMQWAQETFTAVELSGVLAATSLSFDLSVFELFAPLTSGGTVILAENVLALPSLAAAPSVRLVNTVPSALREMLRLGEVPPAVQTINLAGEALPGALVQQLYERATVQRVLNLYGPSEDTTYSSYEVVPRGGGRAPTIGRPVANTQSYVLGEQLEPVPMGVAGELYLGGAGLARGYLNRPGLTAAQFVPNPFSELGGARLYRTGDLARYLSTGELEFLGRRDQQVKVRGYRIELGEIEAALNERDDVREALVQAREDEPGDKRLVAYLVASEGSAPPVTELRDYLRARLPSYMVPASFVWLEALPLTPNGKVDRRALPAPELTRAELEQTYLAPRTPVEELLVGLWEEVLHVPAVGVHDNFFDLGGHSLLATQLFSRVRETCQVEVGLRRLFETPTVAGLAESVEQQLRRGAGVAAPPLKPVSRSAELPLSFAQQRFWFLDQLERDSALYNITTAISLQGRLNVLAMEQTLSEVVRRHEVMRTTFATVEGRPRQVVAPAHIVKLPVTHLMAWTNREAEVSRFIRREKQRTLDSTNGPVWRASLLRLSDDDHVLLFTMHHITSDGWSMGVLVKEVAALYAAYMQGATSPLPELTIQFADYAVWQRELLQGPLLEAQIAYWCKELEDAPPILELPTDRPRPAVRSFRGATQSFVLPANVSEELKSLSRREGVTLFMTLLATFQVLLERYSGQEEFIVGTGIANRTRLETERMVGCFVNFLALRADLTRNPSVRELLRRVRETTLGAYAHQDIPFEKLLEALQPERKPGYPPLFQVAFFLQNVPPTTLELPGLKLTSMSVPSGVARFDIMLVIEERAQGLAGVIEYRTDLFDDSTITRMLNHFQALLQDMANHPDKEVRSLVMFTETEKQQLSNAFDDDLGGLLESVATSKL